MLVVDVLAWNALAQFSSKDRVWQNHPGHWFCAARRSRSSTLRLAKEKYYVKVGMNIVTIGYPMGTLPLTALEN